MQLESTLAQFPLPELITMIIGSSVTGCLEIGEVARGGMFFRDGKLYHAETGTHSGVAAVCQFFTYGDVPFRFTAGVTAEESTIWQDAWDLIEFAKHYAETWLRVQRLIPSFEAVPVLTQASTATVLIPEASWRILAAIDGQQSINGVAQTLGYVPLDVAAALCDLIEQGVVRLVPGSRGQTAQVLNDDKGFLGRLMARAQH